MRFFLLTLLLSLPCWLPSAYRRSFHPFRPAKCQIDWTHIDKWETAPLSNPEILSVLKRPFRYLAKGGQSFVFLSEDGKHVLKIFHYDLCRMPHGSYIVSKTRKWLGLSHRRFIDASAKIQSTFEACWLAFHFAKEQTGLEYVHLNPKAGLSKLTLIDCFGRRLIVDPAQIRFALQKRAEPFLLGFHKIAKPALLESFHTLMNELSAQGIYNNDSRLDGNFGILEGRVIAIDFASFIYSPDRTEERTLFFEKKLQRWMDKHLN